MAEKKKKGIGELTNTRDFINKYKVDPDNWIARLGQRSAQQLVLRDPTQYNVRSWTTPDLSASGQTFNPGFDEGGSEVRRKKLDKIIKDDPLRGNTLKESGYDMSGKSPLAGKILVSPEATKDNNVVLEHEYMHRGLQEMNKDLPEGEHVSTWESYPYMFPETHAASNKKAHPDNIDVQTFTDMFGKPTDYDKKDLERVLALAKKDYYDRYLSGPQGGMPNVYQPHLGDKPPAPPPSFLEHAKTFVDGLIGKAAGGPIEIEDGNPAKRRRMI